MSVLSHLPPYVIRNYETRFPHTQINKTVSQDKYNDYIGFRRNLETLKASYYDFREPQKYVNLQKKYIGATGMTAIPQRDYGSGYNIEKNDFYNISNSYLDTVANPQIGSQIDNDTGGAINRAYSSDSIKSNWLVFWLNFIRKFPHLQGETHDQYVERIGPAAVQIYKSLPESEWDVKNMTLQIDKVVEEKTRRETDQFTNLHQQMMDIRKNKTHVVDTKVDQDKEEYLEEQSKNVYITPTSENELVNEAVKNRIEAKAVASDIALKERLIKDNPSVYSQMLSDLLEADQIRRDKLLVKQDNEIKTAILANYPQVIADMKAKYPTFNERDILKKIYEEPVEIFVEKSKPYMGLRDPKNQEELTGTLKMLLLSDDKNRIDFQLNSVDESIKTIDSFIENNAKELSELRKKFEENKKNFEKNNKKIEEIKTSIPAITDPNKKTQLEKDLNKNVNANAKLEATNKIIENNLKTKELEIKKKETEKTELDGNKKTIIEKKKKVETELNKLMETYKKETPTPTPKPVPEPITLIPTAPPMPMSKPVTASIPKSKPVTTSPIPVLTITPPEPTPITSTSSVVPPSSDDPSTVGVSEGDAKTISEEIEGNLYIEQQEQIINKIKNDAINTGETDKINEAINTLKNMIEEKEKEIENNKNNINNNETALQEYETKMTELRTNENELYAYLDLLNKYINKTKEIVENQNIDNDDDDVELKKKSKPAVDINVQLKELEKRLSDENIYKKITETEDQTYTVVDVLKKIKQIENDINELTETRNEKRTSNENLNDDNGNEQTIILNIKKNIGELEDKYDEIESSSKKTKTPVMSPKKTPKVTQKETVPLISTKDVKKDVKGTTTRPSARGNKPVADIIKRFEPTTDIDQPKGTVETTTADTDKPEGTAEKEAKDKKEKIPPPIGSTEINDYENYIEFLSNNTQYIFDQFNKNKLLSSDPISYSNDEISEIKKYIDDNSTGTIKNKEKKTVTLNINGVLLPAFKIIGIEDRNKKVADSKFFSENYGKKIQFPDKNNTWYLFPFRNETYSELVKRLNTKASGLSAIKTKKSGKKLQFAAKSKPKPTPKAKPKAMEAGNITFTPSHELSQFGYKDVKNMSQQERRNALDKAMDNYFTGYDGHLSLNRKLNALSVVFKKKDKGLSDIFKDDKDYVKSKTMSKREKK